MLEPLPPALQKSPAEPEITFIEQEVERGSSHSILVHDKTAVMRFDMRASWYWNSHTHDVHQLLWAPDGAVTLQTETADWLVPQTMALWIPAGVVHGVAGSRAGRVHCLYFNPARYPSNWDAVTPLAVSPLARELLLHLGRFESALQQREPAEALLHAVLERASSTALYIPMPRDPRARMVAEAIIDDPADARDMADWAWRAHTSERTLRRLFTDETGMPFTQWRLHGRMRAAMQLLADGHSVSVTARKVGYATTASFITAFVRVTGRTPAAHRASTSSRIVEG